MLETVISGKTGKFYTEQTVEALSRLLTSFDADAYHMTDCIYQAQSLARGIYRKDSKSINSVYLKD